MTYNATRNNPLIGRNRISTTSRIEYNVVDINVAIELKSHSIIFLSIALIMLRNYINNE